MTKDPVFALGAFDIARAARDTMISLLSGRDTGPSQREEAFNEAKADILSAIKSIVSNTPWRVGRGRVRRGLAQSRDVKEKLERTQETGRSDGVINEERTRKWAQKNAERLAILAQTAIAQPIMQCKQTAQKRSSSPFTKLEKRTRSRLRSTLCETGVKRCATTWRQSRYPFRPRSPM